MLKCRNPLCNCHIDLQPDAIPPVRVVLADGKPVYFCTANCLNDFNEQTAKFERAAEASGQIYRSKRWFERMRM